MCFDHSSVIVMWPLQNSDVVFVGMKNKMITVILEARQSQMGLFHREYLLHSSFSNVICI